MIELAESIIGALPEPSVEHLERELDDARRRDPRIEILVASCLHGPGLSDTNYRDAMTAEFHALDFAVNVMYDVATRPMKVQVAFHAAHLFAECGGGSYAIGQHIHARRGQSAPSAFADYKEAWAAVQELRRMRDDN